MILAAPRIFVDGAFTGPGAVVVENDRIVAVLDHLPVNADIELPHGILTPGLIDLHNNGAFGVDCARADAAEWAVFVAGLAACGVTAVLPTIITAPVAAIHQAAAGVIAAMAEHPALLGLHLEGPFLAPEKRGAHRADWLRIPDEAALDELLADDNLAATLRVMTLAPELPGAAVAIRRLRAAGVIVALGHTAAGRVDIDAAIAAGASVVTHVFNAQAALTHRGSGAPGLPAVALTDARLHPCLIVDGLHVHPTLLALAFAACPRAIAVTDSILVAGLPSGATGIFGGLPASLGNDGLAYRPDGTIAGAGITLDEGLRRLIAAGISPEIALAAATARPADVLNLPDRGRIAAGARADLVWWDDNFVVQKTWMAGVTDRHGPYPRTTETARPELHDLETRPTLAIVQIFLAQERAAQAALTQADRQLAALADAIAARLAAGGRLFYAGAGTSGRLALLDAVECGPTFGVSAGLIVPILAGGAGAFWNAIEGAEDDTVAAAAMLNAENFGREDALVGIAASGATPFTLAALRHARAAGGLTGAIVNNMGSPIAAAVEIAVEVDTGPEVIAGSTRLSAGTAQKVALNILSSTVMIRLGKTYGPYMVDLRPTNAKLRARAEKITAVIAGVPAAAAAHALQVADMHVKTAVVMLSLQQPVTVAREKLEAAHGSLRKALSER